VCPSKFEEAAEVGLLVLEWFNEGSESLVGDAASELFDGEVFANGTQKFDGVGIEASLEDRSSGNSKVPVHEMILALG
jgi:hypothetical protein